MSSLFNLIKQSFVFLTVSFLSFAAPAQELVTGLSHETIYITSDFTGSDLVVFGTINDMQQLAQSGNEDATMGNYDIVVVIEGPKEPGIIRKKARTAGIWINRDSVGFETIPASYLVMSSALNDDATLEEAYKTLKVGLDHASFGAVNDNASFTDTQDFREAVIRLKMKDDLYRQTTGVSFLGDNLFRAQFKIPALIPVGIHKVHSYLLADNTLISQSSHTVQITKTGFEQLMFDFSREYGYIYGIFCVILAIFTGWLSSVIFRRD